MTLFLCEFARSLLAPSRWLAAGSALGNDAPAPVLAPLHGQSFVSLTPRIAVRTTILSHFYSRPPISCFALNLACDHTLLALVVRKCN